MKKTMLKLSPPAVESPLIAGIGEMHLVRKMIKLDIGCGAHPQSGFVGIDIQDFKNPNIIQHDIETYPWPLPDGCASIAIASHVAEHINPAKFGFINWMNEVWRVLETGGQFMMSLPYAGTPGYWQDPTHVNPCTENTWRYFDPLDPSGFYKFYRPKPWKYDVDRCAWDLQGFMEVVLEKRIEDPSYAQ